MCEKHLGQCFVLTVLHRLPSHSSVFQALIFFTITVFKREIISQSVFYMVHAAGYVRLNVCNGR